MKKYHYSTFSEYTGLGRKRYVAQMLEMPEETVKHIKTCDTMEEARAQVRAWKARYGNPELLPV